MQYKAGVAQSVYTTGNAHFTQSITTLLKFKNKPMTILACIILGVVCFVLFYKAIQFFDNL